MQADRDEQFTAYVEARSAALLRTATYLCAGDESAAHDLVQNTLVKAYLSWSKLRDPDKRDAYVRRILTRESYRRGPRHARDRNPLPELLDRQAPQVDPDDQLALMPHLAALPHQQRAVVVLRYYEDLSERQIADALGCSAGSVKRHASRALTTLRRRLAPTFHESGQGVDREPH